MPITIRQARPDDAEHLLAHIQAIASEPDAQILIEPEEVQFTVEQEREWVSKQITPKNSTLLVAEADGQIVGVLGCEGGDRKAIQHVARLGISVRKEWRNQGVARLLMERAIAWAKETGIVKRIELQVTLQNPSAIHLYEKLGFAKEGRSRQALFKNGQFLDVWIMSLLL
jgi:RimJ/RimL family protein N-acetyltransferase